MQPPGTLRTQDARGEYPHTSKTDWRGGLSLAQIPYPLSIPVRVFGCRHLSALAVEDGSRSDTRVFPSEIAS